VSKETFKRFVQFAYMGDYSVLHPQKRQCVVEQAETNTSHVVTSRSKKKRMYQDEFRSTSVDAEPEPAPPKSWPEEVIEEIADVINHPWPFRKQ